MVDSLAVDCDKELRDLTSTSFEGELLPLLGKSSTPKSTDVPASGLISSVSRAREVCAVVSSCRHADTLPTEGELLISLYS